MPVSCIFFDARGQLKDRIVHCTLYIVHCTLYMQIVVAGKMVTTSVISWRTVPRASRTSLRRIWVVTNTHHPPRMHLVDVDREVWT